MMRGQCRAQRAAGVARRRLHPYVFESAIAQHLAVGHAVERDAAGEAQIFQAGFLAQRAGHSQHGFFGDGLHRCGEVHFALGQRVFRLARRRAEKGVEFRIGHGQPGAVVEIRLVQPVGTIGFKVDEVIQNCLHVFRLAVGRQPHHLVFARIDLEAQVIGKGRIEQAKRVREMDFLENFQAVAAADGSRGGGPFAHAVHGQHQGFVKRRWKESAGRMAQVMLGKQQAVDPVHPGFELLQLLRQQVFLEQLLAQPQRYRHAKGLESPRCKGVVGFQQALELEERLVVKRDLIHLRKRDAGLGQAIIHCIERKAGVVFLAREALLLRGGDDVAILEQGGRAVMIIGGKAQGIHGAPLQNRV